MSGKKKKPGPFDEFTDEQLERQIEDLAWSDKAVEGTSLQCPASYQDNCAYLRWLSLKDELARRRSKKKKS